MYFTDINSQQMSSHHISSAFLMNNGLSGLTVNTSKSSHERYDFSLSDSVVSNNTDGGIDVAATSSRYYRYYRYGYGSTIHTLELSRNIISRNGQMTTTTHQKASGVNMQVDKSNLLIQNNVIESNAGGAITLKLDRGSENLSVVVSNNQIEENMGGAAVSLSAASGTTGPRASIADNDISHNSGGILHDTLSITNVAANVSGNTFYSNTARYTVRWQTASQHSVDNQHCSRNIFYLNVGQKPNERWTILAEGVAASYSGNVFDNPVNTYEMVAGWDQNQNQSNHEAKNNWWGTANLNKAEQKVLDKHDEAFRANIDITPIKNTNPWSVQTGIFIYICFVVTNNTK